MFIYDLSFFLTSTAFVPTNAKYDIPLSRYTVFFENCPLGDAPIGLNFLYKGYQKDIFYGLHQGFELKRF